jgi:hypothetical protein
MIKITLSHRDECVEVFPAQSRIFSLQRPEPQHTRLRSRLIQADLQAVAAAAAAAAAAAGAAAAGAAAAWIFWQPNNDGCATVRR